MLSGAALAQVNPGARPPAAANEPPAELPGTAPQPPESMETIAESVETPYKPKPGGHLIKFNLEDADLS